MIFSFFVRSVFLGGVVLLTGYEGSVIDLDSVGGYTK